MSQPMLFMALQTAPDMRQYILDCPHGNLQNEREVANGDDDAEVLSAMVKAMHEQVAISVWAGRATEACDCEPQGWDKVSAAG